MAQLPLDLGHRASFSGEDFLVAPCNAAAVACLDSWPDWPAPGLAVHGPEGCGKTHLSTSLGHAAITAGEMVHFTTARELFAKLRQSSSANSQFRRLTANRAKLLIIDDRIAWTGGMILTATALFRWHNFAFLAEGPIVPQYAAVFAERWGRVGGAPAPTCPEAAGAAIPSRSESPSRGARASIRYHP